MEQSAYFPLADMASQAALQQDDAGSGALIRVGYAYVPPQVYGETYDPMMSLRQGTAFPCLDLPFGVYQRANWEGMCK